MPRVIRTFGHGTVLVETVHPQVGPLTRGRVWAEPDREGAGAYGVWRVVDTDFVDLPLLIAGDYLTAEHALLAATSWADEPIPTEEI